MRFRFPFLLACLALGILFTVATPASACGEPHGEPCNQDPGGGGGGGGGPCYGIQCFRCAWADPGDYQFCDWTYENASCHCEFPGGICQPYRQCVYTNG